MDQAENMYSRYSLIILNNFIMESNLKLGKEINTFQIKTRYIIPRPSFIKKKLENFGPLLRVIRKLSVQCLLFFHIDLTIPVTTIRIDKYTKERTYANS